MNGSLVGVVASVVVLLAPHGAQAGPEHDYVLHCAGCHKLDGSGSARVPALSDVGDLAARAGGREYLLGVPGVAQAPLSDARLARLMTWVIASFAGGDPAPRFTDVEVRRARAAPLRDPRRVRAALR
jgi:hypothetical protein